MSHTPGPWIAAWDKDDHHIWANGCDIAFLPGEEQGYECGAKLKTLEANGKLMAAAPELLKACQAYVAIYGHRKEHLGANTMELAIAAIAKATGEQR